MHLQYYNLNGVTLKQEKMPNFQTIMLSFLNSMANLNI